MLRREGGEAWEQLQAEARRGTIAHKAGGHSFGGPKKRKAGLSKTPSFSKALRTVVASADVVDNSRQCIPDDCLRQVDVEVADFNQIQQEEQAQKLAAKHQVSAWSHGQALPSCVAELGIPRPFLQPIPPSACLPDLHMEVLRCMPASPALLPAALEHWGARGKLAAAWLQRHVPLQHAGLPAVALNTGEAPPLFPNGPCSKAGQCLCGRVQLKQLAQALAKAIKSFGKKGAHTRDLFVSKGALLRVYSQDAEVLWHPGHVDLRSGDCIVFPLRMLQPSHEYAWMQLPAGRLLATGTALCYNLLCPASLTSLSQFVLMQVCPGPTD